MTRSSKIGTKSGALKVTSTEKFDEMGSFGQSTMDEEIQTLAENVLIRCTAKIIMATLSINFVI